MHLPNHLLLILFFSFLKDLRNNTKTKRHSLNYNMADKTKAPNKEILKNTKKASALMPAFNYCTIKHPFLRRNLLFFKIVQSPSRCHRSGLCTLYLCQTLSNYSDQSDSVCARQPSERSLHHFKLFVGSYC